MAQDKIDKVLAEKAAKYDKLQAQSRKYTAKQMIMLKKAVDAGITVTEAEIEDYLVKHPPKPRSK